MATTTKTTIPASKSGSSPTHMSTSSTKPSPASKPCSCTTTNQCKPAPASKQAPASKTNSKTEFAQDMTKLDDVAIISDVLGCQKSLITLYSTALCESSCENLRKLIDTQLSECAADQFDSFLYMNQRNLYPTEPAGAPKVAKAKQKFMQAKNKMLK